MNKKHVRKVVNILAKAKTSSFILTLSLKTEKWQEDLIDKEFEKYRKEYNNCIGELYKRYNLMIQSKAYQKNCKYKGKDRNNIFKQLNIKYGLTEYSLHSYVKTMNKYFGVNSTITQKIATRAFNAFQKLMFHEADKVKFKPYGILESIEGKSNGTGIIYKDGVIKFLNFQMPIILKDNDKYAEMAIQSRVKFCRLLIKDINGKKKYYVQLILEGIPPQKINKNTGKVKHEIGNGRVGIDIGTQTLAYSSNHKVGLVELAPSINNSDRQIKLLQRKMDRSKRATNANKFNEDGTIDRSNKDNWIFSNRYKKIRAKRKELYRKQFELRKVEHYKLVNELIALGDSFYVETMNYKGLQKRAKETTKNKKGKFNKKKRFGKSLANKAPSMLLNMLETKLKYFELVLNRINTQSVKASQYNHITGEYVKKELKDRWNIFDNFKIQRDLYSSFLIMNVNDELEAVNRDLCFKTFDDFKIKHDLEIINIKNSSNKIISSMGI